MTEEVKILIKGDAASGVAAFEKVGQAGASTMERLRAANQSVSTSMANLSGMMIGLSSVVAAGAFANGIKQQIDYADKMDETAQKAGVTTLAFSELAYASSFAGIESDALVKVLAKINEASAKVAGGDSKLKGFFKGTLGVDLVDASGNARAADKSLMDLIGAMSQIENQGLRSAIAMEAFGDKLGPQLLPLIALGQQGMADLREEAHRLGKVVTNEAGAAAGDLNDNLARLKSTQEGLYNEIATKLVPGLLHSSKMFLENVQSSGLFIGSLKTLGQMIKEAFGGSEITQQGHAANYAAGRLAVLVKEMERLDEMSKKDPRATVEQGYGAPAILASEKLKVLRAQYDALQASAMAASEKLKGMVGDGKTAPAASATAGSPTMGANAAAFMAQQAAEGNKAKSAAAAKALADEKRAAREAFDDRVGMLKLELSEWRNNMEERRRIAMNIAGQAKAMFGVDSKHYSQAMQEVTRIDQQVADRKRQLADMIRSGQVDASLAAINQERAEADQSLALKLITQEQRLGLEAGFEARITEIKRAALEERKVVLALDPDANPIERQKVQQEIEELERQHQARMGEIKNGQTLEKAKPGGDAIDGMEQELQAAGTRVLTNQQSLFQSLRGLWKSAYQMFITELVTKPLAAYIAGQARMTLATWASVQVRTTAEATGATAATALTGASVIKIIAMKAFQAAASVYAAIAGIPYIGPFLAPVMAVGAIGAVLAFGKSVFSAEGGFDIPSGVNPMVQAHAKEMILPAKYAEVIRGLAGGGGGAGGDTVHLHVSAMDGPSMKQFFRGPGGDALMSEISMRRRSSRAG